MYAYAQFRSDRGAGSVEYQFSVILLENGVTDQENGALIYYDKKLHVSG